MDIPTELKKSHVVTETGVCVVLMGPAEIKEALAGATRQTPPDRLTAEEEQHSSCQVAGPLGPSPSVLLL